MGLRRGAIAIMAVLALLVPVEGSAQTDQHQRLQRIQAEIDRKERQIHAAEEERKGVLGQLEAADARRQALKQKIDDLTAQLTDTEARLAEVQASLDEAQEALAEWTRKLERSKERLLDQEETLADRAAAAYRVGPAGYLELILGAEDLGSLVDRSFYVQRVLTVDADTVDALEVSKQLVARRQGRVEDLEGVLSAKRDEVHREVERIATLRAEQEVLEGEVAEQIATREGLLEDIEETKAEYEAAVADLEAQSNHIRNLLQTQASSTSSSSGGGGGGGGGGAQGQLYWPTSGSISSGFGWRTHPIFGTQRFHAGVDIGGACGQPIWAADDGKVVSAGYSGGYGNTVVIDHGGGLATLYAHQSSMAVSTGQTVSRAQTIGYVGTTGWSTGCHLHFEVRVNGQPVDPVPYLT